MRALYVIGEPGVGKSTLMAELLSGATLREPHRLAPGGGGGGTLWGQVVSWPTGPAGVLLGKPRDGFGGTDALPMNVHPTALEWAERDAGRWPEVYGEGQRLGTVAFIARLADHGRVMLLHLVGPAIAERQRQARGSQQNPSWVAGSRTRAANLARDASGLTGVTVAEVAAGPGALADARRIIMRAKA